MEPPGVQRQQYGRGIATHGCHTTYGIEGLEPSELDAIPGSAGNPPHHRFSVGDAGLVGHHLAPNLSKGVVTGRDLMRPAVPAKGIVNDTDAWSPSPPCPNRATRQFPAPARLQTFADRRR